MADPKVKAVKQAVEELAPEVLSRARQLLGDMTPAEIAAAKAAAADAFHGQGAKAATKTGDAKQVNAAVDAVRSMRSGDAPSLEGVDRLREVVSKESATNTVHTPGTPTQDLPAGTGVLQGERKQLPGTVAGVPAVRGGGQPSVIDAEWSATAPTADASPLMLRSAKPDPTQLQLRAVDNPDAAASAQATRDQLSTKGKLGALGTGAAAGAATLAYNKDGSVAQPGSPAPATTPAADPSQTPTATPTTPPPPPVDPKVARLNALQHGFQGTVKGLTDIQAFTETTPELRNSKVEIVNAETGEPSEVSVPEAVQYYAAQQAKELVALKEEYRAEKESARSAALWAEIIRGVAAMAAGAYGMKHGVDMSGVKFDPIDWIARQRAAREGYETESNVTGAKYKALQEAAKETSVADKELWNQDLQQYNLKFAKWDSAQKAALENNRRQFEKAQLSNQASQLEAQALIGLIGAESEGKRLDIEAGKAGKVVNEATAKKREQLERDYLEQINKSLVAKNKKGGQAESNLALGAAYQLEQEYKALTGRTFGPEERWTKDESWMFGAFGDENAPAQPEDVAAGSYPRPGVGVEAPTSVTVKNKTTGESRVLSAADWKTIQDAGRSGQFEVTSGK